MKQQKDHENNLFSIPTTDNAVLLVQRFKDELQKRRQLLEQKRQKQLVLDVNMTRSRMRTVGGITSASSRVPIRRAKNVGESNTDAGVARRVRAGINKNNESGALSQEYVFGGDYKAFIDDYLDENNRSKNCVDLEEQNRIIRELKVNMYINVVVCDVYVLIIALQIEICEGKEARKHCVERRISVFGSIEKAAQPLSL